MKETLSTKRFWPFVLRASFFFRHSDFDIRHFRPTFHFKTDLAFDGHHFSPGDSHS